MKSFTKREREENAFGYVYGTAIFRYIAAPILNSNILTKIRAKHNQIIN